jgi:hypothetical protein
VAPDVASGAAFADAECTGDSMLHAELLPACAAAEAARIGCGPVKVEPTGAVMPASGATDGGT